VPGGAVGVVDGDEVDPAEGADLMHPDVRLFEACAGVVAVEGEGFRDQV